MKGLFISFILSIASNVCYAGVNTWLTSANSNGDATKLIDWEGSFQLYGAKQAPPAVNSSWTNEVTLSIDLNNALQTMTGFGAGLPQSSAYVLKLLRDRNSDLYWQVLTKLFSTDNYGANMNILRFPIGACDFSMTNTSYDESTNDYNLDNFGIDSDSWMIVTVLQDILKVNPRMILIATPWSAPSWLKVWKTLIGWNAENTLIDTDQVYNTYAKYFGKVLDVYASQGLTIQYMTLQNEPLFDNCWQYPAMYLSAYNAGRLAAKVKDVIGNRAKLLAYDHNWDHPEYPMEVIRDHGDKVAGTAWHCYGGNMASAQEDMHNAHPSFEQHLTECTSSYPDGNCDINNGMGHFGSDFEWDMSNIMLGATGHWAQSGVKWILALDEHCGPVLPDVTYRNGRPLVAIPSWANSMNDIKFNVDYWSVAHMSRFVAAGSHRVGSSLSGGWIDGLVTQTFVDGSQTTTLAMNTDKTNGVVLTVKDSRGRSFTYTIPPFSTAIFQWE